MKRSESRPAAGRTGLTAHSGAQSGKVEVADLRQQESGRPLKIGMIAPPWFAVPPMGYGGIEWVVSHLTEGLVERGHDITLFASGGSSTSAELVSTHDPAPSELIGEWAVEAAALMDAYHRAAEFDLVHDHSLLGLLMASMNTVPTVHTVHGPMAPEVFPLYERLAGRVEMIAISHHQQSTFPPALHSTVIHNAVDASHYPVGTGRGDYLLFVGRICREKGILDAIEIARRADKRLLILGKVNEQPERDFFEAEVRPALDGVRYDLLEQVTPEVKAQAYGDALGTLFPIDWPEPFGLVPVESMAAGTPVIAYPNGAVPELMLDGRTGFLCGGVEAAVAAVDRLAEISRSACRNHVIECFSVEKNVLAHERLYRTLVPRGLQETN